MDNFSQLKSSIEAVKNIVNIDISPAFDDLSNNSQIFNDLVNSQNQIEAELLSIESLISSNVIKGDQGIQGKSTYDIAVDNGFQGTELDFLNNLSILGLSTPLLSVNRFVWGQKSTGSTNYVTFFTVQLEAGFFYEFFSYVPYSTASTYTGILFKCATSVNNYYSHYLLSLDIVNVQTNPIVKNKPPLNSGTAVVGTGVTSANTPQVCFINGTIFCEESCDLVLSYSSEINNSLVVLQPQGYMVLKKYNYT